MVGKGGYPMVGIVQHHWNVGVQSLTAFRVELLGTEASRFVQVEGEELVKGYSLSGWSVKSTHGRTVIGKQLSKEKDQGKTAMQRWQAKSKAMVDCPSCGQRGWIGQRPDG